MEMLDDVFPLAHFYPTSAISHSWNISSIYSCLFLFINSIHNVKLKREAKQSVVLVMLSEWIQLTKNLLAQKSRSWIQRRSIRGYFNNITCGLMIESRMGFKDMFRMTVGIWIWYKTYAWYSFFRKYVQIFEWRHRWRNVRW